jgi:hypothetical protein
LEVRVKERRVIKDFFSAEEAAEYLSRTVEKVSMADVRRLAEEGRLPVCFHFGGMLGVYPSPAPVAKMFAPPLRHTYFPAGYLRARSGVAIDSTVTDMRRNTSTRVVLHPTVVELARAGRGFGIGESSCDPPGRGEAWWIVRPMTRRAPAQYARHFGLEVGADRWLFHVDDLRALRPDMDVDHADAAQPKASRAKASSPGRDAWWPRAREFVTRVAGSVKWGTGKDLYAALLAAADSDDSPFEPNLDGRRNDLVFKVEAGKGGGVSQKTLANALPNIREAVKEAKERSRFPAGKQDRSGKNGSE